MKSWVELTYPAKVAGEALKININHSGFSGWTFGNLLLKRNKGDADSAKVLEIAPTTVDSDTFYYKLTSTQTTSLSGTYYGKITGTDSNGDKRTLALIELSWEVV